MSKEAVAIVRVDPARVREALAGDEADVRTGANGEPLRITALADATLVHLGTELAAEPSEHRARLSALLGDLLDEHDDARGVPLYPSTYTLAATTWEAALDELGEAADWVPLAAPDTMGEMLKRFNLGMMGGDLGSLDPQDVLASAMEVAREMAGSSVFQDIAKRFSAMEPGEGSDPWKALERAGATGRLGEFDLGQLTEQARRMLEESPELEEELRKAIQGAGDDSSDDDE